ncbi:uncharacterized protein L201_003914 [Kwoniella dendrophila CBS 6074]|uniref:Uncharacterized protein n=1 Tax=Kwoniella dendrophila CBS 6074 TaxID=1295534 RepID=A0AAX4JUE0_9TREE
MIVMSTRNSQNKQDFHNRFSKSIKNSILDLILKGVDQTEFASLKPEEIIKCTYEALSSITGDQKTSSNSRLSVLSNEEFIPDKDKHYEVHSSELDLTLSPNKLDSIIQSITSKNVVSSTESNSMEVYEDIPVYQRTCTPAQKKKYEDGLSRKVNTFNRQIKETVNEVVASQSQLSDIDWNEKGNLLNVIYQPEIALLNLQAQGENPLMAVLDPAPDITFWRSKNFFDESDSSGERYIPYLEMGLDTHFIAE